MELIVIIAALILAYAIFLVLGYFLARLFFPSIESPQPLRLKRSKERTVRRTMSRSI